MANEIRTAHHCTRGTVSENGRDVAAIINLFTAQYSDEHTVALSALSAGTMLESGIVMNANAFEELATKWLAWRKSSRRDRIFAAVGDLVKDIDPESPNDELLDLLEEIKRLYDEGADDD